MKIEFITLWVDDRIDFMEGVKMHLEDWLEEKGFELKVLMHINDTGVLQDIEQQNVELIIIDYKIPDSKNGDMLIQEIRDKGFYQDIIFYSGGDLPETRFDGVFYVRKEDARTRIKELIELKLKRTSDPVSVRGWIVADSIELEEMVTNLLSQCFGKKEGFTLSERLLHPKGRPFLDFGAKHQLFDGTLKDLISHLNNQDEVDKDKVEKLRDCKVIFENFMNDVVHVRNAIAHQKIEDLGTGKTIKTQKGPNIVLNEDTFIKIRKDLRKHRDNLISLQSLI